MAAVAVIGTCVPIVGCGKPVAAEPARVTGTVTIQGRALAGGLVVFVPDADRGCTGRMHTAAVDADGRYVLADGGTVVVAGWYRVAISDAAGLPNGSRFPARLRRPDLSGLSREVKANLDNTFDFHIELTD